VATHPRVILTPSGCVTQLSLGTWRRSSLKRRYDERAGQAPRVMLNTVKWPAVCMRYTIHVCCQLMITALPLDAQPFLSVNVLLFV
jgi:hypothetical protein